MDKKKQAILDEAKKIKEAERKEREQLNERLQQREKDMAEKKKKYEQEVQKKKDELNAEGKILEGHQAWGFCPFHKEEILILDEPSVNGKVIKDPLNDNRLIKPCPKCLEKWTEEQKKINEDAMRESKECDQQIQKIRENAEKRKTYSNEQIYKKIEEVLAILQN